MTDAPSAAGTQRAVAASAAVLAAAFAHDPVVTFLFERCHDAASRRRALFDFLAGDAADRHVLDHDDDVAAIWHKLPPPVDMPPAGRVLADSVFEGCTERRLTLRAALQAAHPEAPHWYLFFIGTAPVFAGKGRGTLLLRRGLARADQTRLPCYLEATSLANARLYERHGFVRRADLLIPDGPTLYPMWRAVQMHS